MAGKYGPARHRVRTSAGPAAKYQLEWFRIDTLGTRGRGRHQRGDVLLQVTADNEWLYSPRSWTPARSLSGCGRAVITASSAKEFTASDTGEWVFGLQGELHIARRTVD